jgi:hypothetical protein
MFYKCIPPSTVRHAPVVNEDISDAKYPMVLAISSALVNLPIG